MPSHRRTSLRPTFKRSALLWTRPALGGSSLAARYQALSADHLEFMTEDDARAMAESGTVAAIHAQAGDFVEADTVLVALAEAADT